MLGAPAIETIAAMKRRLICLGAVIASCWSLWLVIHLTTIPTNRVTRENYDKIQLGMTRDEVVGILGPQTTYGNSYFDFQSFRFKSYWEGYLPEPGNMFPGRYSVWQSGNRWISICFHKTDSRVIGKRYRELSPPPAPPTVDVQEGL